MRQPVARPILFSASMIHALLGGWKTQTRRLVTPNNIRLFMGEHEGLRRPVQELLDAALEWAEDFRNFEGTQLWSAKAMPWQAPAIRTRWQGHSTFGMHGDLLWTKETLRLAEPVGWRYDADRTPITMPADDPRVPQMIGWAHHNDKAVCVSIHQPQWASRMTLLLTEVRMQRLHDITEADALAEGIRKIGSWYGAPGVAETWNRECCCPRVAYFELWKALHGEDSYKANPWVWALSFTPYLQHVDAYLKAPAEPIADARPPMVIPVSVALEAP